MATAGIIKDLVKDELPYLARSMSRSLEESQTGKIVLDTLRNKLEPMFGKSLEHELTTLKATNPKPPIGDVLDAVSTVKRNTHDAILGTKKQFVTASIESMYREKGIAGAQHLANIWDVYNKDPLSVYRHQIRSIGKKAGIPELENFELGSGYSAKGEETLAKARQLMAPAFLPRIAIPHFTQAANNLLTVGWKNTLGTVADIAKQGRFAMYNFAARSGALSTELQYEMMRTAQGQSKWLKLLDPLNKVFLFERKWQLVFAASAGKRAALEAADSYVMSQGADKAAELQLKLLGLDPAEVMQLGGQLVDKHLETAGFRNAQETMFIRSPLQTPRVWQSNVTMKVATMYKDYGFNQAKLVKDSLLRAKAAEGWVGVAKTMATLGTVFFAAGEFVKQAENAITLEKPKELQKKQVFENEYLDALAHFGGFGIYYSMLRSATQGGLTNYIAGPLISTGAEIGSELLAAGKQTLNRRIPENEIRRLMRSIGLRAGIAGRPITNYLVPPNKAHKKDPKF